MGLRVRLKKIFEKQLARGEKGSSFTARFGNGSERVSESDARVCVPGKWASNSGKKDLEKAVDGLGKVTKLKVTS